MAVQRGNKWQANAYLNGKRVRPAFDTKEEAEAFERDPTAEIIKPTVDALFRHGYEYLWATKRNPDAWRITEELITMLSSTKLIASVGGADVQDLVMRWRKKGNSGATINRKLSALRMLLKHAQQRGVIDNLPMFPKHEAEGQGRERFLTDDEAASLLAYMPNDAAMLFAQFLLHTGARVGEALELRWADVGPSTVTFRWQTTKSKKTRVIGLNKLAKEAVDKTRKWGWSSPWEKIDYDRFVKDFRKAKERAGLGDDPEVVPHILRHTHASWLVQRGVSIQAVSKLLGHSSITVTMRYAKLAPDDLLSLSGVLISGDCAKSCATVPAGVAEVAQAGELTCG